MHPALLLPEAPPNVTEIRGKFFEKMMMAFRCAFSFRRETQSGVPSYARLRLAAKQLHRQGLTFTPLPRYNTPARRKGFLNPRRVTVAMPVHIPRTPWRFHETGSPTNFPTTHSLTRR